MAFATQKGGAGKSTLTTLVASYLHYAVGIKVLAIDCDPRQFSMVEYRNKDVLLVRENETFRRRFVNCMNNIGGEPYKIIRATPTDAIQLANIELENGYEAEYVFFDITGTINDSNLVFLLANMDYLFVPITPETGDLKSSIGFSHNVHEAMVLQETSKVKGLYLVWNKVQTKDRNNICEIINQYLATLCLESLETMLPLSVKYTKDGNTLGKDGVFRSTLLPPEKRLLRNSYLPELVDEIRRITNPKDYGE